MQTTVLSLAALFAAFLVAPTAWGQSQWASKPLPFNACRAGSRPGWLT
ncbi:MAG: hypothetical protein NUW22_06895 [Acidobacteria bacterium]|nr:hypothetical protein [Acidobacteriota bacterium]